MWSTAIRRTKVLTFDCYGTLIDWKQGMKHAIAQLVPQLPHEELNNVFDAYLAAEAQVEAGSYQSYRSVMSTAFARVLSDRGITAVADVPGRFAASLTQWPPFLDTVAALQRLRSRFRLGVLSNVDRDLFSETAKSLMNPFDFVITAQDVQAYKPARAHFERMLVEQAEKDEVIHVAQSLFHDGTPADQLGLAFVWINRYQDARTVDVPMLGEFPTLAALADAAEGVTRTN